MDNLAVFEWIPKTETLDSLAGIYGKTVESIQINEVKLQQVIQ